MTHCQWVGADLQFFAQRACEGVNRSDVWGLREIKQKKLSSFSYMNLMLWDIVFNFFRNFLRVDEFLLGRRLQVYTFEIYFKHKIKKYKTFQFEGGCRCHRWKRNGQHATREFLTFICTVSGIWPCKVYRYKYCSKKASWNVLPLRFRKAGRVWCGGARETHWATCHNEVTSCKTKEFLKSLSFFRSYGSLKYLNHYRK